LMTLKTIKYPGTPGSRGFLDITSAWRQRYTPD